MRGWIIGGIVALIAAAGAFLLLRDGNTEAADGDREISLPAGIERADIETVVHDYILDHPEIIPEAMQRVRQGRMAQAASAVRGDLERPFAGGWAGNPNGRVTVVEFFDYACGFCRQSVADVQRLIAENDDVKVVFRELPILSPESHDAAQASLAAARSGNYYAFHLALYGAGRPSAETIAEASRAAGVSASETQAAANDPAVAAELAGNMQLAQRIGLSGTPVFVIGDEVFEGAIGYDRLHQAVEAARAAGA